MRVLSLLAASMVAATASSAIVVPTKTYACNGGRCQVTPTGTAGGIGFGLCKVTCEKSFWPMPSGGVSISSAAGKAITVSPAFDLTGVPASAQGLMKEMTAAFTQAAFTQKPRQSGGSVLSVSVKVTSASTELLLSTDESYTLSSSSYLNVVVEATTVFGARHALETLAQVVYWNEASLGYEIAGPTVTIKDVPAFPYRGVMVDTARNFVALDTLHTIIRGMAASKLNTLHLHLSDTASFPLEMPTRPNMTIYGAYSNEEVYRVEDVIALRAFGLAHGVRVVPEIDQPGHARQGWQWGKEAGLGELVVCNEPGLSWTTTGVEPPPGQMNPTNPNVHVVLGEIYTELVKNFGGSLYHLGGDEVIVGNGVSGPSCWNDSSKAKAVTDWIADHGYDRSDPQTFYGLWANFTKKSMASVQQTYKTQNKQLEKIMQWAGADGGWNLVGQAAMRAKTFPVDTFMFQVWDTIDKSIAPTLMNEGYDLVMSNSDALYFDCGGATWVNDAPYWCKYNSWYTVYDSVQTALTEWGKTMKPGAEKNFKGAEAAMWTEKFDSSSVLPALFPRASALGEALWTNPKSNWHAADPRMEVHRDVLVKRGIAASALQPQWCLQNGPYSCTV